MKVILWLFLFASITFYAQDGLINYAALDNDLLNQYILKEVNTLRKKVKLDSLVYDTLLMPAANDHSDYMLGNRILTHFQKNKEKKAPKNRVDFYGMQFEKVGENVQKSHVKSTLKVKRTTKQISLYSELAKSLVSNWEHSPPHYKNIINPNYQTTFTAVKIDNDGSIYACQLFANNSYLQPKEVLNEHQYSIYNEKKCKRCSKKNI